MADRLPSLSLPIKSIRMVIKTFNFQMCTMIIQFSILSVLFPSILAFHSASNLGRGFVTCHSNVCEDNFLHSDLSPSAPLADSGADLIREQIEEMRTEAIVRLEKLNKKLERESDSIMTESSSKLKCYKTKDLRANKHHVHESSSSIKDAGNDREPERLLEDTSWKITMMIGRENGTWMPKEWGSSGERILLNLAVKFSGNQFGDSEEFLGSKLVSKQLYVINNELTVAPSLTEGSRKISVKNGGWRVLLGEGPAGTDLLRFFIEIEEKAEHKGSDVYCPKGRIYCTCGYFPATGRPSGIKEAIRSEQEEINRRYDFLKREEEEDTSILSLRKITRSKQMFDLLNENQKLTERMREARIQEPQKDLLRFTENGTTALTKEGGLSCKVMKGLTMEYHILGRFSIASCETSERTNNLKAHTLSP